MKKWIGLLCALCLTAACAACGGKDMEVKDYGTNYKVENTTADTGYLYGMCNLAWEEPEIDAAKTAELMANMGVKSVRMWMHCNWLMADAETMNEASVTRMREMLTELSKYEFQLIGMNHSNFHDTAQVNGSSTTAKPARDLTEGSAYRKWLADYETTWYNLAKTFPEIDYWEIDNETNNDDFMPKLGGGKFTLEEKAAIYTDMMYYGSRGIHRGNPQANTIMGGMIMSSAETFLQYVYDNIAAEDSPSKYPDDYFQIACWHPYMAKYDDEGFKADNQAIYDIIVRNEGKQKKVFFTEMGWSAYTVGTDQIAAFLPRAYAAARSLGFVESVHYFRMYDVLRSTWGSPAEKQFGLFGDPTTHGNLIDGVYQNPRLAAPKAAALAYKTMAGGTGSLTILEDLLNG